MSGGLARLGLALLLLATCVLVLPGAAAWADDGAAVADAVADAVAGAEDDAEAEAEATQLESKLLENPVVLRWGVGTRVAIALLGLAVLVVVYRRWSRGRAGLDAEPLPFTPGGAVAVAALPAAVGVLLLYVLAPAVLARALSDAAPEDTPPMLLVLVGLVAVGAPIVLGIWLRRRHLRTTAPAAPGRVLFGGFLTCCVGSALALPALFLGAAVLQSLGQEVTTYEVVEKAVDPAHPQNLWLITFLAVVVAPLVEETIFRGLLYPAVRDAAGGGSQGFWVGAILVSALFGAAHGHLPSFLPLFCLAMVFTWVFERTNSLATVVVAHALFNLTNLVPLIIGRAEGIL